MSTLATVVALIVGLVPVTGYVLHERIHITLEFLASSHVDCAVVLVHSFGILGITGRGPFPFVMDRTILILGSFENGLHIQVNVGHGRIRSVIIHVANLQEFVVQLLLDRAQREAKVFSFLRISTSSHDRVQHLHGEGVIIHPSTVQLFIILEVVSGNGFNVF